MDGLRILLVGHGRMGRLVGELAPQYGGEVVAVIDPQSPAHAGGADDDRWRGAVDVAIDESEIDYSARRIEFPDIPRHHATYLCIRPLCFHVLRSPLPHSG